MEIKKLACELESWAQEKGWKTVTQLISPEPGRSGITTGSGPWA